MNCLIIHTLRGRKALHNDDLPLTSAPTSHQNKAFEPEQQAEADGSVVNALSSPTSREAGRTAQTAGISKERRAPALAKQGMDDGFI